MTLIRERLFIVPTRKMETQETSRREGCEPPVFKKPKQRNKHVRARPSDDANAEADDADADGASGGSSVVRSAKTAKPNPLVQSTGGSSSGGSLQKELAYGSDVRLTSYDNKATASSEQDVEHGRDAQAQYEEAKTMWDDGGDVAADGSKIYRGAKAYRQYTGKAESYDRMVNSGAGPARAPVHYRATSRFDYQPDICKDYKDTGFCGYGDACKFLHDRSDYKTGWQLERQWDAEQKAKAHALALAAFEESEGGSKAGSSGSAAAAKDDGLPFACLICREPWHAKSSPVVTKCEHYFCERCALQHAAKTKRCHVCAENTHGIFNKATAIQEKIDAMASALAVEASGGLTDEQILAEYEAEKKKGKDRGGHAGWAIV